MCVPAYKHASRGSVPWKSLFPFCCASLGFPLCSFSPKRLPVHHLSLSLSLRECPNLHFFLAHLTSLGVCMQNRLPLSPGGQGAAPGSKAQPRGALSAVLAASSSSCPPARPELPSACQSQASPAHLPNAPCKARQNFLFKSASLLQGETSPSSSCVLPALPRQQENLKPN